MNRVLLSFFIFLSISAEIQARTLEVDPHKLSSLNLQTCFSPEGQCDQKLIEAINSAQKSLDVSIYIIEHKEIASAIMAAKDRGVAVRMVVDKSESEKKRSQVKKLLKAKVPLKIGKVKGIMHNKFSIIDSIVLETGSFNYKMNASNANAENQIYLTDTNVIKKYQETFDQLWVNGLEAE